MAGALCEVKLNCLTLPTRASLWTMWALATTVPGRRALGGQGGSVSITAARNRRSAATGVVISRVQQLVDHDAIAATNDRVGPCLPWLSKHRSSGHRLAHAACRTDGTCALARGMANQQQQGLDGAALRRATARRGDGVLPFGVRARAPSAQLKASS